MFKLPQTSHLIIAISLQALLTYIHPYIFLIVFLPIIFVFHIIFWAQLFFSISFRQGLWMITSQIFVRKYLCSHSWIEFWVELFSLIIWKILFDCFLASAVADTKLTISNCSFVVNLFFLSGFSLSLVFCSSLWYNLYLFCLELGALLQPRTSYIFL